MTERKYATAAALTKPRTVRTEDVELDDGSWVQVRGLTRQELLDAGKGNDGDASEVEIRNVTACLVQPKMTEAQVRTWHKNPETVRDFAKITGMIRDLSGLGKGADKSDLDETGDGA